MTTTINSITTDEEVINDLIAREVAPDYEFTAAAGSDWGDICAWRLPDGRIAVKDGNNAVTNYNIVDYMISELDPVDILCGDDRSPLSVGRILGVDAVQAAQADDRGPFLVLASCDYYGPTSEVSYITDGDTGDAKEFDTLTDAQAWIDARDGHSVYLSHNQSAGPSHKVVSL